MRHSMIVICDKVNDRNFVIFYQLIRYKYKYAIKGYSKEKKNVIYYLNETVFYEMINRKPKARVTRKLQKRIHIR
jgi:hypothetical protein